MNTQAEEYFQRPLDISSSSPYRISQHSRRLGQVSFSERALGNGIFLESACSLRVTGPFGQGFTIRADRDRQEIATLEYCWRDGSCLSGPALSRSFYIAPGDRRILTYDESDAIIGFAEDFSQVEVFPLAAQLPESPLLLLLGMAYIVYSERLSI